METLKFIEGIKILSAQKKECDSPELRQFVDWTNTFKDILSKHTIALGYHAFRIREEGLISNLVYASLIKDLPEEVKKDLVKVDSSEITEDERNNIISDLIKLVRMWETGAIQRTELIPTATEAAALKVVIEQFEGRVVSGIKKLNNLAYAYKQLVIEMLSYMKEYINDILVTVGIEEI